MTDKTDINTPLLSEVNRSRSWFCAVKIAPVWARPNQGEFSVNSREGVTSSGNEDMICRGPEGEIWTQGGAKFHAKYEPIGEIDDQGFEKYHPRPEEARIMAAKIERPFQVSTSRGVLSGEDGDYLVKSFEDRDQDFPDSIWIVAGGIFDQTYARVEPT